jgi:hypothetical protein
MFLLEFESLCLSYSLTSPIAPHSSQGFLSGERTVLQILERRCVLKLTVVGGSYVVAILHSQISYAVDMNQKTLPVPVNPCKRERNPINIGVLLSKRKKHLEDTEAVN